MKILYDDVKKQIANAKVGYAVEVLVAKRTRYTGSSLYYNRRGILVEKTETSIKVLIGRRNYNMKLYHQSDWIEGKCIDTEYASGLYNVQIIGEGNDYKLEKTND